MHIHYILKCRIHLIISLRRISFYRKKKNIKLILVSLYCLKYIFKRTTDKFTDFEKKRQEILAYDKKTVKNIVSNNNPFNKFPSPPK